MEVRRGLKRTVFERTHPVEIDFDSCKINLALWQAERLVEQLLEKIPEIRKQILDE